MDKILFITLIFVISGCSSVPQQAEEIKETGPTAYGLICSTPKPLSLSCKVEGETGEVSAYQFGVGSLIYKTKDPVFEKTFTAPQKTIVSLQLVRPDGTKSEEVKSEVEIYAKKAPEVDFHCYISSMGAASCTFEGKTKLHGAEVKYHSWIVDEKFEAHMKQLYYQFEESGKHKITLQVTSTFDLSGEATKEFDVTVKKGNE